MRCQSIIDDGEEQCEEEAEVAVRERSGNIFGWSGNHCKDHALRVVNSHWHHAVKTGIEIIPLSLRRRL